MSTIAICATSLGAGCSVTSTWHAGPEQAGPQSTPPVKALSREQIEAIGKERIEQQYRVEVESLVCDGPLQATVGATQRCIETAGGEKIGMTLIVTKIDGQKVDFRMKIDDHPIPN
ncbi:DUF4333 domain-containing protein [Mycolicibacterium cosmeticum]|uniref:DUF4333 domain-containing protein n=1 Tax=Mycolicibacterium cosmeticum TaxID=258533 RepID=UPI001F3E7DB7|nr:DUF4333 domain-containing protein [Mycolicibacterium cosmeticum]